MELTRGQQVQVREWEDMLDEFGYEDEDEMAIGCKFGFVEEMREFCGRIFTVDYMSGDSIVFQEKEPRSFHWSEDMIILYDEDEGIDLTPASETEIDSLLAMAEVM